LQRAAENGEKQKNRGSAANEEREKLITFTICFPLGEKERNRNKSGSCLNQGKLLSTVRNPF